MKVLIIGLGYIGLPTAAVLASRGVEVVGLDVSENVVKTINEGKIHIVEPDLDMLVHAAVETGKLRAVLEPETADAFMIAVPTPFKDGNKPDLTYIRDAAKTIAPVLEKGNLVILESTSPVGTTELLTNWLAEERDDLNFPEYKTSNSSSCVDVHLAYCPERVLPGHIVRELVQNDRIVGGMTEKCSERAKELYKKFVEGNCLLTSARTAEMCKLTENAYRDINIAFANELSLISDKLDIDVWDLISLANHHPRVNILQPGPGVGGHCIAVDPWFIVDSAPEESRLIRTAREVNDFKPKFVLNKIEEAIAHTGKNISELNVTCLGLSFKPNIDDLRESPALDIATSLSMKGFNKLHLVEPNIEQLPDCFPKDTANLSELENAISDSEIIILLVDHAEFQAINSEALSGKIIIDTRGVIKSGKFY